MFLEKDTYQESNRKYLRKIINKCSPDQNRVEKGSPDVFRGDYSPLMFGFDSIDVLTGGACSGDLLIVAARPCLGREIFALNIVNSVCKWSGIWTVYFNLISSINRERLFSALLSIESNVSFDSIRLERVTYGCHGDVLEAGYRIADYRLIVDDDQDHSFSGIMERCRKYRSKYEVGFIVIDYLQLIEFAKISSSGEKLNYAKICSKLKKLAGELGCAIMVISTLPKVVDTRKDNRPVLKDLYKYGSSIIQNADTVLFLYREVFYHHLEGCDVNRIYAEIVIGKARYKEDIEAVKLLMDLPRFRMEDRTKKDSYLSELTFIPIDPFAEDSEEDDKASKD